MTGLIVDASSFGSFQGLERRACARVALTPMELATTRRRVSQLDRKET